MINTTIPQSPVGATYPLPIAQLSGIVGAKHPLPIAQLSGITQV